MSAFNLKRFTQPEVLRSIHPRRLVQLLASDRGYFEQKGVPLPEPGNESSIDYEGLSRVFMEPDAGTPVDLANKLYFVHEMATREHMEILQDACEAKGIVLDDDVNESPADVAVQVWLADPDLLERAHAELRVAGRRSFEYFQSTMSPIPTLDVPPREALDAIERDLNRKLKKKKRLWYRVLAFPKDGATWFLVRHGRPVERMGVLQDGESSTLVFRPEAFHVLAYDGVAGDLRMNADTKGEKDQYRKTFGQHLFGDEGTFSPDAAKYTLAPLRTRGEDSLTCTDIDEMDWVKLRSVEFYWGGSLNEIEVRKADDVFAAFTAKGRPFPHKVPILSAGIHVKFRDAKNPRPVTIRPPRTTVYTRDSDSAIVEKWLWNQKFIVGVQ